MSASPTPTADSLILGCITVSRCSGLPAQHLLAHALLFGTVMVGAKACYRRLPEQAPQLIPSPTTILTNDIQCPPWFATATEDARELQESASANCHRLINMLPHPRQVKMAKQMTLMYRPLIDLIPDPLAIMMRTTTLRPTRATYEFLHDLRKGSIRQPSPISAYGSELLALAIGDTCYSGLLNKRDRPGSLFAQAAESNSSFDVSIHGWANMKRVKKLFRASGFAPLSTFGWLLEFPPFQAPVPVPISDQTDYKIHFKRLSEIRFFCAPLTFTPPQAICEMLEAAVSEQTKGSEIGGLPTELVNPQPMLVWQLATILWVLEYSGGNRKPAETPDLARLACRIGKFIHSLHLHTLRQLFPTRENGTCEKIDAQIVDKLAVEPLHLRSLQRKFHCLDAENLKFRLKLLADAGTIHQNEDGLWQLTPFQGEDWSVFVSKMSAKTPSPDNVPESPDSGTASTAADDTTDNPAP